MTSVRVAGVQDSPVLLDQAATLDRVDELTDWAAEQGAQLVVFPDAFVPGPPVWIDALPIGDDAEWHSLWMHESVTVPGPACDRLAAAASRWRRAGRRCQRARGARRHGLQHGVDVRAGRRTARASPEADTDPRRAFGVEDGRRLGPQRARHASRTARVPHLLGELHAARALHLYAQGPEVWLAPTLATADCWVASMRHIAREGCCFVLGVAPVMHPDSIPDATPLREDATQFGGWLLEGYSVIVAPTADRRAARRSARARAPDPHRRSGPGQPASQKATI